MERKGPLHYEAVHRTHLTPVSFLQRSACIYPDKIAVVHGERRYVSGQAAAFLTRRGRSMSERRGLAA
jgi:hypothetical protein